MKVAWSKSEYAHIMQDGVSLCGKITEESAEGVNTVDGLEDISDWNEPLCQICEQRMPADQRRMDNKTCEDCGKRSFGDKHCYPCRVKRR